MTTAAAERILIGGSWRASSTGATFATLDPATGEPITEVAEAGPQDVDAAVDAARAALGAEAWAGPLPAVRARILWRVGDLIDEHADELAELETRDQGPAARHLPQHLAARRRRALPLLRGLGHEDRGSDLAAVVPRGVPVHAARARRRVRPHHGVELPAHAGFMEDRPRPRVRQRGGGQARRAELLFPRGLWGAFVDRSGIRLMPVGYHVRLPQKSGSPT